MHLWLSWCYCGVIMFLCHYFCTFDATQGIFDCTILKVFCIDTRVGARLFLSKLLKLEFFFAFLLLVCPNNRDLQFWSNKDHLAIVLL